MCSSRPWRSSRRRSRDTPLIVGTHHSAGADRPAHDSARTPDSPAGFPESRAGHVAGLWSRVGGTQLASRAGRWSEISRREDLETVLLRLQKETSIQCRYSANRKRIVEGGEVKHVVSFACRI
jgi:hypothetical protein